MDIKKLVQIKWMEIKEETIIYYPEIKDLCSRAYPGYPKGCINIEKCRKLNKPDFGKEQEWAGFIHFYILYAIFDFKKNKELRKEEHPDWSEKQCGNSRHWQNTIKSMLRKEIERIHKQNKFFYVFSCGSGMKLSFQIQVGSMENACINVFSTMKLNGVKLETHPKEKIYLCNLLCSWKPIEFENLNQEGCLKCNLEFKQGDQIIHPGPDLFYHKECWDKLKNNDKKQTNLGAFL